MARSIILGLIPLLCSAGFARAQVASPEQTEFFERRVRPILIEHCYECHSGQAKKLKGGLRLDSREAALKGGESRRAAVVPGEPEKSLLIEAVRWSNDDLQMPPKNKLSDQQIQDLMTWVKAGAAFPAANGGQVIDEITRARQKWPYTAVARPAVPPVEDASWPRNRIDHFILARLEEKGLKPAPPAEKRALIRRATYDLTGLPPTIKDVEDFLADESPHAFAKVVDRLLASPAYGQRYARHWLDVVRYTDSFDARDNFGPKDAADAWRYRDWVVDSFNRDLPYDQFIKAQIAGDILAAGLPETQFDPGLIIATGVYAFGNWGGGDADKDKLLTDIADDQVDLTTRAFLGLTVACARCHDHKFDPISTEDYYALAGIFFSSHILPDPGPKTAGPDMLKIPLASKQELERRDRAKTKIAELEKKLDATLDESYAAIAKEVIPRIDRYLLAAFDRKRSPQVADEIRHPFVVQRLVTLLEGADLKLMPEFAKDIHDTPGVHAFKNAGKPDTPSATINTTPQEQRFITITMPPRSVAVHPSPKAGVSIIFRSPISGAVTITATLADADPNCGDGIQYKLLHRRAGIARDVATGTMSNAGKADVKDKSVTLTTGDMMELLVLPKGDYSCDTTVLELILSESQSSRVWRLSDDILSSAAPANPVADRFGNPAVWHFVDRAQITGESTIPPSSVLGKFLGAASDPKTSRDRIESLAKAAATALRSTGTPLTPADAKVQADLTNPRSWFWSPTRANDTNLPASARQPIADLHSQISTLKSQTTKPLETSQGLQEGGVPNSPHTGVHDVKLHIRGRYDRLGPTIPRRFPQVLAGNSRPTITQGSGRLQLADWIASASSPLTARVMANRLWQWHFGEGIVRTTNNFGKLGTPPTHLELLDYLADEFIKQNWSIKAMHRLIMLSATYQQSAAADPATLKTDPDNLLLTRANRRRLDAESLRDTLLAVTGELDHATGGGRATKDLNSPRRTLYLMTVRSDRSGYRMLFDAADPTAIVEKRIDSTVAPQALWLLNHPFTMDRARKLAAQLQNRGGVPWLYRQLYARDPFPREIELANRFLGDTSDTNRETQYCHALLCSNELMYID